MFPFGSSSLAQDIIDSRLSGVTASTPMQPQDMNEFGVFRNPYSPAGFYANETDVNPKPPFTPPTSDEEGNPVCDNANGYYFDPITQSCKLVESESTGDSGGGDNNAPQPVYQGVGSVFSPAQNAFMNMGLGAEGLTAKTAKSYYGSGEINPYGTGLTGMFRRFTPLGQLSTYLDTNRLLNAGVLNKADDGTLTFAKGGNLKLAQANQAFEQDLARKQGLDLDAQADTPYDYRYNPETKQDEPVYIKQSRGDKADDMGTINFKGRSSRPFQSNFGASNIVSYSPPDPNREKTESEKMFERKRAFATPTKTYNTEFKGKGFIGGR
tara:strand:- start:65 stop:1036 length:972 start_codon:yes stop_codon:yes gene_type:complete